MPRLNHRYDKKSGYHLYDCNRCGEECHGYICQKCTAKTSMGNVGRSRRNKRRMETEPEYAAKIKENSRKSEEKKKQRKNAKTKLQMG